MRREGDLNLKVLETIDHAYAAVLDETRWTDALHSLSQLLDARAVGIRIETMGQCVRQHWIGLDAAFDRAYVDHYWRDDPWALPARNAKVGLVAHGEEIVSRRIVEASAFHNDLALPNGFDDLAGAVLERTETRLVSIGAMKGVSRNASRFTAADTELLGRVAPHFQRALELTERLASAHTRPITPDAQATGRNGNRGNNNGSHGSHGSHGSYGPSNGSLEEILARRYRLTPAETRVAIRVGRGLSPKETAMELGVSWYTIRAQLRQVFAKTETRGQRELARLVTLTETALMKESLRRDR